MVLRSIELFSGLEEQLILSVILLPDSEDSLSGLPLLWLCHALLSCLPEAIGMDHQKSFGNVLLSGVYIQKPPGLMRSSFDFNVMPSCPVIHGNIELRSPR